MATEGRFDEIELAFIRDELDIHGEYVLDILHEALEAREMIDSGDLDESMTAKVGPDRENPTLSISFLSYGRASEIRWHRSKNRSVIQEMSANRRNYLAKERKRKIKDTRWYAKNVYGSLNRLIGILMYELTDQERERIKGILKQQQIRKNTPQ